MNYLIMKTSILLILNISLFLYIPAYCQWSTDPTNPGVVCNVAGIQNQVKSFADGNGGAYVFWADNRNNQGEPPIEIYGQHYDNDGYKLWETDGRLILSHSIEIKSFDAKPDDNGMIFIGMITRSEETNAGDTLRFQLLDDNGIATWSSPLIVAVTGSSENFISNLYSFIIMPINNECYGLINVTYIGGANGNRFIRIDEDRNLLVDNDGITVGNQTYVGVTGMDKIFDNSNDFFMYYATGNGSGADLHCFRINNMGGIIWGPVNVTDGTTGLNYQPGGTSDENGITFVWEGTGATSIDLFSRRINNNGVFDWGGNVVNICDADGEQGQFDLKRKGMYNYITWADARPGVDPGNFDIYAQKIDTSGNIYWAENGIEVSSFNTYIPYPLMAIQDDNSLIINHQSTVAGFMAQKVADDGSLPWGAEAEQICTSDFNPFYQQHAVFLSDNNTIAVWNKEASGGGSDGIYITRIDSTGTTGIGSFENDLEDFGVSPNPAYDYFEISLPSRIGTTSLSIYNSEGRLIESTQLQITGKHQKIKFKTFNLPSGVYIIKLISGSEINSEKLIIR